MKLLVLACLLTACAIDPNLDEVTDGVTTTNKLATNKLATNKLATNKLAAQKLAANGFTNSSLIETADGRDVLTYIVRCALTANQSITVTSSAKVAYTFTGEIGLGSAWTTRALTVSEQRWVSACVLARTNYYGVQVDLSLRGDNPALNAGLGEVVQYSAPEAAFYGNLFDPAQPEYACIGILKKIDVGSPSFPLRQCAVPSGDGVTTMCGFTYTGGCGVVDAGLAAACASIAAPYTNCHPPKTTATTYHEVITVELPNALMPAQ